MDSSISAIQSAALALGACDKIDKVDGFPALCRLFFSAQGQEFCEQHNFPTLETFRAISAQVRQNGIFVDAGDIRLPSQEYSCLVGDTRATIEASGVKHRHIIVLMHGASATINASNYAVIKIVNISGGRVEINKDDTVYLL